MKNNLNDLMKVGVKAIESAENIYLVSHINPDGDNLGSLLGLGLAIKGVNPNLHILKTDKIPKDFLFLPQIDLIREYSEDEGIDLLIVLDCSDEDRLGDKKFLLDRAKTILNIDHHKSNSYFGDINIVDPKASATGELVYKIIRELSLPIGKDIATCIYTAISSDTGSFVYSNTNASSFEIAADLFNQGIDHNKININLYQNRSLERTFLLNQALNSMKFYQDKQVALVKISQDMLERSNASMEDTEGIVSFIKEIDQVELAVLLKEIDETEVKVSMRSKRYIDVAKLCASHGGGGHARAAGCTIHSQIDQAEEIILKTIIGIFG